MKKVFLTAVVIVMLALTAFSQNFSINLESGRSDKNTVLTPFGVINLGEVEAENKAIELKDYGGMASIGEKYILIIDSVSVEYVKGTKEVLITNPGHSADKRLKGLEEAKTINEKPFSIYLIQRDIQLTPFSKMRGTQYYLLFE